MSRSVDERANAEDTVGRSEEREAFLFRLGDAIRPLRDPASIPSETCQLLGTYLRANRVIYGEIDGDVYTVTDNYVDGVTAMTAPVRWTDFAGGIGDECDRDGVLVVNDTETDPRTERARETLKAAEIGAYVALPQMKDGRVVSAFGVHSRTARVWTSDEITLVRRVTDRIWAALELRRAEAALRERGERLAFLLRLNDALRPLHDPSDVQEAAARLLGEHLQVSRVGYAEIEGHEYVIRCEYVRGVPPLAGRGPVGAFVPSLLEAYRRGETVVVNDVGTDPRLTEAERTAMGTREIAAFVGVTLLKDGQVIAAFGANQATPRAWKPPEVELVRDVAERTWDAVQRARAEAALRESEERLRLAQVGGMVGVWDWNLTIGRVTWSPELETIFGVEANTVRSYGDFSARVHPDDLAGVESKRDAAIRAHKPFELEFRIVLPSGETRWLSAWGRGFYDEHGRVVRVIGNNVVITERKRLEEALRRREERLAFLLTLNDTLRPLNDPVEMQNVTVRLLGEHLRVNRVAYSVIDGEDYIVKASYDHGVAPVRGRGPIRPYGAKLFEAYQRGEPVRVSDVRTDSRFTDAERANLLALGVVAFLLVMLHKEGRWVASLGVNTVTPRDWTDDEVTLLDEAAERMWLAAERAEREWRLQLALDASGAGCWTRETGANHVDWDEGFLRLYQVAPDEPRTFETWVSRIHEEDRRKVFDLVDETRRPKKDAWDTTFRIVRPDGTVSWIQSLGRVERDAAGAVTRLAGLELDVTARRQVEEMLQARRDEEHNRELKLLLETATQGIASVDAKGTIVTANRMLGTMFGWQPGELIGQPIERLIPSAVRDTHEQHRTNYFAAPHPRPMGGGLDLMGERRDGSTFPIEVTLNHVVTSGGGRAFAFVTDITDRQARTAELEHRMKQLSRLASDLTLAEQRAREQLAKTLHDGLQQQLAVTALLVEQQLNRDTQEGTPAPLLGRAKRELDEAIDAARTLSVELSPPLLQSAGLPTALTWLADWTRRKYGLDVHISADPLADSTRKDVRALLFESVRELLFNVVKHAEVNHVTVDVALQAADMLRITVADQGIGFDPEGLIERAKAGNVGWGLFSIRERVTLLGGRFEIESAPGRGTRFRLIAPTGESPGGVDAHRAASHVVVDPPASDLAGGFASAHALRIVIADDHAAFRRVLRELLDERPQLRVVGEAANGLEAIAQAHALQPDVVLMDIAMPLMDGVEATRHLRAELPLIHILGVSMQPRMEGPHAIEQAGAAGFFVKGVDTQRMIDHLMSVHAGRRGSTHAN